MQCPKCRLINPDTAARCDCGYDFETATIQRSYAHEANRNSEPDERRWKTSTLIKLAAWLILVVATGLYFVSTAYLNPGQLGRYMGKGVVYFAIVAIILGTAGRHRKPLVKSLLFLIGTLGWAGYLTFAVVSVNTDRAELAAAKYQLRSLVNTGRNIVDAQAGLGSGRDIATSPSPSPSGDNTLASALRKMNVIIKDVFGRAHRKQAEIAEEMNDVGIGKILLPQSLTSIEGIRKNRDRIAAYRRLTKKSLAISNAASKELGRRVKPLFEGTSIERDYLNGYKRGLESRRKLMSKFAKAQMSMLDSMEQLNSFMAGEIGRVRLDEKHPVFPTQREVNTYNHLLKAIRGQAQIIREIRIKRQKKMHEMLGRLQKLAS